MDTKEDELKAAFFDELRLDNYRSYVPTVVISFMASIGSGKSYLAAALSEKLDMPIFDL